MKKTKILRIIARLNIGGPAIHAVLLNQGLDKNKFETLLLSGRVARLEGDMSYYALEKEVDVRYLPELGRELSLFSDLSAVIKILNIIRKESPDIIHTHTAKAGALGRSAGILYNLFFFPKNKARLVHTFHGHVFSGYFGALKSRAFVLIERLLAVFTDKVITVSESVKSSLLSYNICKEAKIQVIPLGLELDNFLGLAKKEGSRINIGIAGRLVPVKNHRMFLDSVSRLIMREAGADIRCKIIGDGELRGELEDYARRLKLSAFVEFCGWQKEMHKAYAGLDIVALSSLNEGTPVSLIEALASAKAVVATDVGGVRDLLGVKLLPEGGAKAKGFIVLERGVIVRSGDSEGLSEALAFLIKNKDLRQSLGERGREFVGKRFSKRRLLEEIEELYSLMARP